jgi:hypothetical protein
MPNCKLVVLLALIQGAWPCAAIAADPGTEGRIEAAPPREVEEFRFEDFAHSGKLNEIEEAVRAALLRAFPIGSNAQALVDLIVRREPHRGRYCHERTEDMVWCQYWHPWSGDPRLSIMYWVQIYHVGEPKEIKDIRVRVVAG